MTALAQGSAGVALVMCFALLRTSQVDAAAILLAIQSIAVAATALVLQQPLMAIPPLILAAGFWLLRRETPMFHAHTAPTGGAKLGIAIGAVLAILCQSQGSLALPSAVVLLSILLATTRSHPLMQVAALVAAQNGLALAGSLVTQPTLPHAVSLLLPIACLVLPLPLVSGLLVPAVAAWPYSASPIRTVDQPKPAGSKALEKVLQLATWCRACLSGAGIVLGWLDLGIASAVFAATLIVPLDSLASVFAPLLGLDGVLRSYVRRNRRALTPTRRVSALLQSSFTVLVACSPNLTIAWLMLLATISMALLPTMSRRWNNAVLALFAAGLCLFGILLLPIAPSVLAYFSLFTGFVTIAAVVPDVAVVLVILLMRLGNHASWPPGIETLGIGIGMVSLLACAILLTRPNRPNQSNRTTLLVLSQASIAALAICVGHPEERFAALVLLVLLILSRAAARITVGPVATFAIAGLGGLPPLGVFPGLVLVVLAISAHDPWLLLPLGAALIPIVWASCPRHLPSFLPTTQPPSIAWLPLLLAVLAGYCAPNALVHWWRILTSGPT